MRNISQDMQYIYIRNGTSAPFPLAIVFTKLWGIIFDAKRKHNRLDWRRSAAATRLEWYWCGYKRTNAKSQTHFWNYWFSRWVRLHGRDSERILSAFSRLSPMFGKVEMEYAKLIEMPTICERFAESTQRRKHEREAMVHVVHSVFTVELSLSPANLRWIWWKKCHRQISVVLCASRNEWKMIYVRCSCIWWIFMGLFFVVFQNTKAKKLENLLNRARLRAR